MGHKIEKKHRSGDHRRSHDGHRRRPRSHSHEMALVVREASGAGEQPPDDGARLFVVDKRGDPLILKYGTNDRSRVPEYRRLRSWKVLGSREPISISREGAKEEFSSRDYRDGGSMFREKHHLLQKAARSKGRTVRQKPPAGDGGAALDPGEFMLLSAPRKRRRSGSESTSGGDEKELSYRSILGKTKRHENSDSDSESEDGSSTPEEAHPFKDDPVKRRSMELSRLVKEHPEDMTAWLELVDLQDSLFAKENGGQASTPDEVRGLADIKASLLESALRHAKLETDMERLLVRLMREGSKAWNPARLAKRWQDVAQKHPANFDLWRSRLDFEMANMSTFSFDRLRSLLLDRLRFLRDQLAVADSAPESTILPLCRQLVYVFLRATRFFRDSGLAELAVAAWQAQMELAFFCLQAHALAPADAALALLQPFWESEVPRIGEDGAKGWAHFVESGGTDDAAAPRQAAQMQPPETRDVYKAWAATEQHRMASSQMPARTLDVDSDGDDDPFRYVMFSDIEELLFALPPSVSHLVREQLIDAFLLFADLPPAFAGQDWTRTARYDSFIAKHELGLEADQQPSKPEDGGELSPRQPNFFQGGSQMCLSPEVLFGGPNWFNYLPPSPDAPGVPIRSWALNTAKQLARGAGVEELAEYSLALEWSRDPNSAKKAAKSLLKLYPARLPLYNAYALAERANGNTSVAQNVLLSATGHNKLKATLDEAMPLWQTRAWMELEDGRKDQAAAHLCLSVDEHLARADDSGNDNTASSPSPSQLLKARQKLHTSRDYQLSLGNTASARIYAQSLALLEYLTAEGGRESAAARQGNISAAMASVASFSDELASRGLEACAAHEVLLQFASRLLYFHARHGPYRPVYLGEQLVRFVRLFPRNTVFLSLVAWADAGLRVDDPVRDLVRSAALVPLHDCVAVRAFAVRHEMRVGNAHSTRAAFEDAVASEACRGSVGLWRAYVRFCHRRRKDLRPKAKDVFYRTVHACPWSKALAMEAFTTLVKEMDTGELAAIYDMLQTKGLRIHVDMGDFVEEWRKAHPLVS